LGVSPGPDAPPLIGGAGRRAPAPPPPGRTWVRVCRLEGGEIVEAAGVWDRLDFVEQLGLGAPPAPTAS